MKFAPTILAIAWTILIGNIGITNAKSVTYLLNRHPSQGQLIEPDLGYPLNSEDLKYYQSKEYQDSLKHQSEGDEYTNPDMFEGDIDLDNEAKRILQERGPDGLREVVKGKKWPKVNGLVMVPYRLASGLTEKQRADIRWAEEEFREKTCVRLVPVTNTKEPFVQVNPDFKGSCFVRNLGMDHPGQVMGLSTRCSRGTVVHEFMHSLGHFHEHTRNDRDDYVTITIKWIDDLDATDDSKDGFRRQYTICNKDEHNECEDLKSEYDYGSIMHYPKGNCIVLRSGERKCDESIIPKQSGVEIGQRKGLSALDIESIHERYDC